MIIEIGRIRSASEQISKSGFRTIVLELECKTRKWDKAAKAMMPTNQVLPFKCLGKSAAQYLDMKPGTLVQVDGHHEAREWQGRTFVDLVADQVSNLTTYEQAEKSDATAEQQTWEPLDDVGF